MTGTSRKRSRSLFSVRRYPGNFAWHYPPPFLFIAALLAKLPYAVAFAGWAAVSFVPYLAAMRAIVGRPFGLLLAAAFPVVMTNGLVEQNGFLTAALIGGMLVLLPTRPILSGICLGLLSYKPQYGFLFPLMLIAASQWKAFVSAGITTVLLAAVSWLAFGTESWQAFIHWMPMFSQAFLTEGRAPWGKMQSIFRTGALFRRQRAAGLDVPVDHDWCRRSGAGAVVAQQRAL